MKIILPLTLTALMLTGCSVNVDTDKDENPAPAAPAASAPASEPSAESSAPSESPASASALASLILTEGELPPGYTREPGRDNTDPQEDLGGCATISPVSPSERLVHFFQGTPGEALTAGVSQYASAEDAEAALAALQATISTCTEIELEDGGAAQIGALALPNTGGGNVQAASYTAPGVSAVRAYGVNGDRLVTVGVVSADAANPLLSPESVSELINKQLAKVS